MSTTFYLADARYMTPEEIGLAEKFDDSAILCHRRLGGRDSGGRIIHVYSLFTPEQLLRALPADARLVNNNNAPEHNIGDLVTSMGEQGAVVKTVVEVQEESKVAFEEWVKSRQGLPGWSFIDPETRFTPTISGAALYILRKERPNLR